MAKYTEVVVLAEDKRHANLLRRYLERLHYDRHQIKLRFCPGGQGAAEQWVRNHYAAELAELRRRRGQVNGGLIVVIDGDIAGLDRRLAKLEDQSKALPSDPVARLIPTRNIETWILCLIGDSVDEITDYRHDPNAAAVKPAAAQLYEWTRNNAAIPERCVPSLRHGIAQLRGFEQNRRGA